MPAVPPTPSGRRNEQHRCPHCGGPHTISIPRGAEKDYRVETLPGPEPETGVVD